MEQTNDATKMTEKQTAKKPRSKKKMSKGGVNLLILGVLSVAVAGVTTGVSLLIYHNSGDIYLDRSRPGYLPDETEIEDDENESEYDFEKSGKIDADVVEEYLDELNVEVEAIDAYDKPFGAEGLSNERLGIPVE